MVTPSVRRRAAVARLLTLLIVSSACTADPTETASPATSPTPGTTPALATASPVTVEIHEVPVEVTELLQDYRTDGKEIVFSSGPVDDPLATAPDLYRYNRDTGAREIIFSNPDRDSNLLPIAVSDGQYAFAEINPRLYGEDGWALWYMSSSEATPRLLDRTDAEQEMPSPLPLMSMSGHRIAWQAFHQTQEGARSQLLLAELPDGDKRVLFSARPDTEEQYWTPSLDGDQLVYSVVDYSEADTPRHVYLIDLADPDSTPRRLDTSGRAVTPAIHGDSVVWKEADDVFDWGTITRFSLANGRPASLTFGRQEQLNYPSVGDRFVAAWGRDYSVLYVYDLERREAVVIEQWPESPPAAGSVRPLISGRLLLWVSFTEPQGSIHLKWAELTGGM